MKSLICITLSAILLVAIAEETQDERPIISLKDGRIRGIHRTSFDGSRKYSAFEGIPYAKPPIANLRFKEPQPVQPWSGILEATTTHTCIQYGIFSNNVIGSEDCLYLNVYVSRESINPEEDLDVIVHFHGGAFMGGTPQDMAGPSKLMDRDVVYVNLNYRLGPLGFLNFGDDLVPGNFGMKDQTFALLWVKNNIKKFGGNPNSVSIIGGSAGGASVHLHYFSPLSKGLFHRGIANSGIALAPWAIRKDPYLASKTLAKNLGCHFDNTKEILRCIQERSAIQIQETIKKQFVNFETLVPLVLFGPVIEPPSETAFLTTDPYTQFEENLVTDVPLLTTLTTEDGSAMGLLYLHNTDLLNENLQTYFPILLEYDTHDAEFKKKVTERIVEHYLDNEPVTLENYNKLIKLAGDRYFNVGVAQSLKLHASKMTSSAYFLLMGYGGTPVPGFEKLGVGHGHDIKFYYDVMPMPFVDVNLSDEEVIMKNKLIDMVVSFAKTGVPTIEGVQFEPVPKDGSTLKYLRVTSPHALEMTDGPFADEEFWDSIGLNENRIRSHKSYNKIEL